MNPPNHWSHPFPRFSYKNSQIQIEFYHDPALPSCSEYLYPNESWRNSQFVLVRNSQQVIHMHPLSDFQPWALRVPFTPPSHSGTGHRLIILTSNGVLPSSLYLRTLLMRRLFGMLFRSGLEQERKFSRYLPMRHS